MKGIVALFGRFCIAEHQIACRHGRRCAWLLFAAAVWSGPVQAQDPQSASATASSIAAPANAASFAPQWLSVPRARGRLRAADIGLVINSADRYSVAVGAHYIQKRLLQPKQVLRVELPVRSSLKPEEFEALRDSIEAHFGAGIQALALAWVQPYAVECNSITGALALGFDAGLCRQSCAPSRVSAYANSASAKPLADHGMRLSMLLAAHDVDSARRLIDRGVAADRSLGLRGAPPAHAYFLTTDDAARNVRARLYPPAGLLRRADVDVQVEPAMAWSDPKRVLLVHTGDVRLPATAGLDWVDGGLGDHLTSYGGQLDRAMGQATALDWVASGATASHGSVSEPCNHLQKFPHPQWLLLHYRQGITAIEAYWKSVLWPQQSLFVGEPLAAPYARR
jgi:uncharacterized protein (TIGR03790 family)